MSEFFAHYPQIDYNITGTSPPKYRTVINILTRAKFKNIVGDAIVAYHPYSIPENERPDVTAYNYYGDVKYYWTILLLNKMYNRYYDWPMTERDLREYVNDTYADPDGVHHYEVAQSSGDTNTKIRVESDATGATAVTNFEYEREENDGRKQILLLQTTYLGQFVEEYGKLLKSAKVS